MKVFIIVILSIFLLACGSESSVTVSQDQQVGDDNDITCNTCTTSESCEEIGCFAQVPDNDDTETEADVDVALGDSDEGAL